eukprot:g28400.t1
MEGGVMMFRHVIPECDSGTGQELVKELAKCSELEAQLFSTKQALEVQQQELEKERLTSADLGRQCEAWQAQAVQVQTAQQTVEAQLQTTMQTLEADYPGGLEHAEAAGKAA